MSAHLMPALQRTIDFLREAARAPASEWPSFARALATVPKLGCEGGTAAMAVAAVARSFVRTLPDLQMEGDAEIRATLKGLADVLQHEFNARYVPPYYQDKG